MLHTVILLCFYTLSFTPTSYSSLKDGLVSSPWGKIKGVRKTTLSGLSLTSFEGIPYAKPPLGDLRFSKPVPSKGSQQTILMADAIKPSCLVANLTNRESEDCLYLDLYVPDAPSSEESSSLPVMVFIHGGGFMYYPGDAMPEPLLAQNVIVALVHFRLGAMGFLSTGDGVLKGNYALWDQRMAIQWVKDNVAAFGGNPNSITVFGQSSGAAGAAYHVLSPESKGLFQRAILLSGTANAGWTFSRHPASYAYELGHRLGCALGSSSSDLAKCLRRVDGVRLQKEVRVMWNSRPAFECQTNFMFVPVVDHEYILDEPWKLVKNHSHLQSVGAFDKDVIAGILNNEGTVVAYTAHPPSDLKLRDRFDNDMTTFMLTQRYGISNSDAENAVKRFYKQTVPQTLLDNALISYYVLPDLYFMIPALEFIETLAKSKMGSGRHYFYYLDYCPTFSPVQCMRHGLDLSFLFSFASVDFNFTSADDVVSETFGSLLTTFSKTGIPWAKDTPTWPPFSPENEAYLHISYKSKLKQKPFPSKVEFWSKTVPSLIYETFTPDSIFG